MIRKATRATGVLMAGLSLFVTGAGSFLFSQAPVTRGGKALFERRCGGCHALDRDKEGPRLAGAYGRPAGSVDTFQYSDALKASEITWDSESLNKWLTDPERLVPNNDMAFRLEKAEERREVIAYLKENSQTGK